MSNGSNREKEFQTRDRPAERGITISNILQAVIVIGGTVFGTLVVGDMHYIRNAVDNLVEAIATIRVHDSIASTKIETLQNVSDQCKEYHAGVERRLDRLELECFSKGE